MTEDEEGRRADCAGPGCSIPKVHSGGNSAFTWPEPESKQLIKKRKGRDSSLSYIIKG